MPTTPPSRVKWRFLRLPLALVGGYALGVAACLLFENTLVHYPRGGPDTFAPKPTDRFEDVALTAADGTALHAWWLPPETADSKFTVLYCHGKGGNLSGRAGLMVKVQTHLDGCGVLQFDYPGYGRSGGFPTETGCYAAADAAYHWLTDTRNVPPREVVLLGDSLGGGVAVELATRHDCRAVALAATYTTLPEAAADRFWFLPCRLLMRNRFDSVGKIGRVTRPVFVAHGTADDRIPLRQGEELFAAAHEPKRFVRLDGRGHNDWACDQFFTELRGFLK